MKIVPNTHMPNCKEMGSEVPEVSVNLTNLQLREPIHMRTNAVMAKMALSKETDLIF